MNPDKENQNLLCYRYTTALKLDGPRAIAVSYIPLGLGLITPHYKHWEGGSRTHARGFGDLCATVTLLPKLVETKGIEPLLGGCKPPVLPLSLSPQMEVRLGLPPSLNCFADSGLGSSAYAPKVSEVGLEPTASGF